MSKKIHDVLLGISVLPALLIMPAFAADPITDQPVFVFGDVSFDNQHVANGEAAFGGRRMNNWVDGKYQNDFPKYQMVGSSFSISNSEVYIGPVTLTLRELTDNDAFVFNYQDDVEGEWTDTDLAANSGVVWNTPLGEEGDTAEDGTVYGLVSEVIGAGNAHYTAPTVWAMSQTNPNAVAGSLTFNNVQAVVDGATINAITVSVTNGSVLNIVKQNNNTALNTASFFTDPANIDSDGMTTISAGTINFDNSRIIVSSGAGLTINAANTGSFANSVSTADGSAINNSGTLTLINVGFSDNGGGYGGAIENAGTLTATDVTFTNNSATFGGALDNYAGNVTINGASEFSGNNGSYGGALSNDGGTALLTINGNVVFSGNTAAQVGGAIYNNKTASVMGATFNDNSAIWGGAIYNHGGTVTVGGESAFNENTATYGGAIYVNTGSSVTVNDSTFSGNSAGTYGGAMFSKGGFTVTGATFDGNHAEQMGAIGEDVGATGNVIISDTTFSNNYAKTVGAVAVLAKNFSSNFDNVQFISNHATDGGSGALFVGAQGTANIANNSLFDSNTAVWGGGAIGTRGFNLGDNHAAKLDIANTTFTGNIAGTDGGAINNSLYNDAADDGYVKVTNSTFTANQAANGGAIYNHVGQDGDVLYNDAQQVGSMYLSGVTFTGNIASENGGAIYNEGEFILAGTNSFSGNTAGGVANDIHNVGALTFATDSETTMDGGITGTGMLNIASGAELNLGTASIAQTTITLDGALNAVLRSEDEFAFFDVSNEFGGEGTLNFDLRAEGTYNVFKDQIFNNENVVVSSSVFDYEWNDTFDTITATMKSVEDIAAENGLTEEAAASVTNLVNSSSEELNDLANAMQDSLNAGDAAAVEQAHKAIHPETESVAQSVAMSVQNTVANLASGRLMALTTGRNGGDVNVTGGGIWAQGIYNKTKQNDAFRGYTRGVAAGADMTLDRALTLGAGYSYAHSDISGTARNTEVDSSTIFAYAQYKPTNWFMNAMANYTMSDYSEHADALGTPVDASYDVRAYGGQVMTGYDFAGGITPAVGVRYMHLTADEYKNSLGIKNKLADSDYMTAILETKWTYGFKLNKNLTLRPELRYAVKYDIMSDEQSATILLPGVDSYVLDGNRLSRLGAEFGGGLGMKVNGVDLSLNYDIEIREGFTSQTGRARIRIEF